MFIKASVIIKSILRKMKTSHIMEIREWFLHQTKKVYYI